MSTAIAIYHGRFGRASLYHLNRPMVKHAHREGHLTFLVSGSGGLQEISGKGYVHSPESATAVNPWEAHDFKPCDLEHGAIFLVLYIKPIWFLEVARSAKHALRFGRTQIEITETISRSIQKVAALLLENYECELFDGYLYELTQECFDQSWQWKSVMATFGEVRSPFTDFRIRKSIELMKRSLGSEIELDVIARESGISRPHFFKLFRKQTGLTPNLFLNTLRMETAIESLTETNKSVTDIGFDLGFSSQSSFTRFFCSNVGMAPTEYRRVAYVLPV
jgi:AraC-like DNA-binding protein